MSSIGTREAVVAATAADGAATTPAEPSARAGEAFSRERRPTSYGVTAARCSVHMAGLRMGQAAATAENSAVLVYLFDVLRKSPSSVREFGGVGSADEHTRRRRGPPRD